jgi:hypothetical protein
VLTTNRAYEIRGSHPEYKVPKPGGGRLDNKLPKDLETQLLHKSTSGLPKNFVRENIKKQLELEHKSGTEKAKSKQTSISEIEAAATSKELSPQGK